MSYAIIDVSGDVGIRAVGDSLEECFSNAALGLYSLITDLDKIETKEEIDISISEDNIENLVVCFLNELIYVFDTQGFIGRSINLKIIGNSLVAKISGEKFNADKHDRKLLIKAATYHNLVVRKQESRWIAEIIFDI